MYSVEIKETSRELTAKERIMLKDTTNAIKLDEATQKEALVITPVAHAVLNIHNDKAEDKDYENYIIIDKDGNKFVTGSCSFWSSYLNIVDEMVEVDEAWELKIYRVPSKNYKGKEFITCSII